MFVMILKKKMLALIIAALILAILIILFFYSKCNKDMIYGVSYNQQYAEYLGLDAKKVYQTIIDDWGFRYLRLTAQWNLLEKTKGQYDFTELDWLMDEAAKKNARVILVVGRKTPRWPECHLPVWAMGLEFNEFKPSLFDYIAKIVERYKNHPALEMWQVENEPFLAFGKCSPFSVQDLQEELNLVKKIDPLHKTMVTDSGELSLWRQTANVADFFGTTLYTVVWHKVIGYWSYNWILPPSVYKIKLWLNGRDANTAFISELQAEPWIPDRSLTSTPMFEQFKSMSLKQLKKNMNFAAKTGMPRAYLWGAEWWYWLEKQGHKEFAEYVKSLKKE